MTWRFQYRLWRQCLIAGRRCIHRSKSTNTSHMLAHATHEPITFYFLITFKFVKRLNYPLV
jgi:hypothetical protein